MLVSGLLQARIAEMVKNLSIATGPKFASLLIAMSLMLSCGSSAKREHSEVSFRTDYCKPTYSVKERAKEWFHPVPVLEILKDRELLEEYTLDSLQVANAYGMVPLLRKLHASAEEIRSGNDSAEVSYLRNKLAASQMIAVASADLSSTVSEIQCRSQKLSELIDFYHTEEKDSELGYTIASVISGAFFGILSGAVQWASNPVQAGVAIVGGAVTGYFGLKAFDYEAKVDYDFGTPILGDLYADQNTSGNVSDSLWYLLDHPSARSDSGNSLRQILVQSWDSNQYLGSGDTRTRRVELFFRSEGHQIYSLAELETLREMLKQVVQTLNLLNQKFQTLADEIREA